MDTLSLAKPVLRHLSMHSDEDKAHTLWTQDSAMFFTSVSEFPVKKFVTKLLFLVLPALVLITCYLF